MNDVKARLAALEEVLELRRLAQMEPIDPLSASLYEFVEELAGLDEIGIAALAGLTDEGGKPILTLTQAQQMADSFKKGAADRRLRAFRAGV